MHPDSFEANTDYWDNEAADRMFETAKRYSTDEECRRAISLMQEWVNTGASKTVHGECHRTPVKDPPKPFEPKSKKFARIAASC